MKSKIIALLMVVALAGCATKPQKANNDITIPPTYSENIPIPTVEETDLKEVQWKLMNKAEMAKFVATADDKTVIYTLDDENASHLLGNMQELRLHIRTQKELINYLIGVINARQKPNKP